MAAHFSNDLFKFLKALKRNNDREWFNRNKARYEEHLKDPALQFIADFGPHLRKISRHFTAEPKATGGSLFRIYRDTRFAKDKTPYKTHVGIHFRHEAAKDAHTPGFYLHLEPGGSFIGAGLWRPDTKNAQQIRQGIADDPKGWKRAAHGAAFLKHYELAGESLKRPPRGFDADHAFIDDLKRKDFIATGSISDKEILSGTLMRTFTSRCKTGAPLVSFICGAVGAKF